FRHIVFDASRSRAAMNYAPAAVEEDVAPPAETVSLREDEESFLAWLFRCAHLEVRVYRPETLLRRLRACLRALRVDSVSAARRRIGRDPSLLSLAMGTLVIGVTSFFRDGGVFD